MSKYYEKTKSKYSRDIDHLVTFNKNGLWIREVLNEKQRIISAKKPSGNNLMEVSIFHIDKDSNLLEKQIPMRSLSNLFTSKSNRLETVRNTNPHEKFIYFCIIKTNYKS